MRGETTGQKRPRIIRLMPVMDYGGVETIVSVIAENLPQSRYDLRVCTFWKDGEAAARVREAGIPCDVLDVDPALRNPRAPLALARYLAKWKPDLLHASISEANFHACLSSRLFPRLSLLLEEVGTPDRSAKARRLFGLAYRRADGFIGVSEATCTHLIENEGVDRSKVHLIYNCVDSAFFDEHPRRTTDNVFNVGVIGRLVSEKNHQTLLDAWEQFSRSYAGTAELHVIGSGPLERELKARRDQLVSRDTITFHGFRNDVATFLETLDAVVLPSTNEGYGIALVEAMAQAIPVIGSDAGGVPEVLSGFGEDWIVPARDVDAWAASLLRLAELSPEERDLLGQAGQRAARKRFSPQEYISALSELYDQLLRES